MICDFACHKVKEENSNLIINFEYKFFVEKKIKPTTF